MSKREDSLLSLWTTILIIFHISVQRNMVGFVVDGHTRLPLACHRESLLSTYVHVQRAQDAARTDLFFGDILVQERLYRKLHNELQLSQSEVGRVCCLSSG